MYGSRKAIKQRALEDLPPRSDVIHASSLDRRSPTELHRQLIAKFDEFAVQQSSFLAMQAKVELRGNTEIKPCWCVGCQSIWAHFTDNLTKDQLKAMSISTKVNNVELKVVVYRRAFRARACPLPCIASLGTSPSFRMCQSPSKL